MIDGAGTMSSAPRDSARTTGLVFNIQRYSLHDGPGIRSTVFLKGCPLACAWCHNPESIAPAREFIVAESRCIACGECREACPYGAATPGTGPIPSRNADCDFCAQCADACPTGARELIGRQMSVAEVRDELLKDAIFFAESGGGVTVSGGEPLMQWQFVEELLPALRERGIHTALDTSGYAPLERLLTVAARSDLVLYDLKGFDEARHIEYTGVSNASIHANLRALDAAHANIWIRVPIVPGFIDDAEDLSRMAALVSTLHHVTRVSLLPFHGAAERKYERLGRVNRTSHVDPPTAEQMERSAQIFRAHSLPVHIGA